MLTAAVDFESYYDDEISITTLGSHRYFRTADIYMVSIVRSDGSEYVGHPKDFDWSSIVEDHQWVSHNQSFDGACFKALAEKGIAPAVWPEHGWYCTADMTAFLGFPRSLKVASSCLLQKQVSKDVRKKMKGLAWEEMTPDFQAEVTEYALWDSRLCLELWQKHSHKWPEHERQLSQHTAMMSARGVAVDREYLLHGKSLMEAALDECRADIPWGEPLLSKPQFDAHCESIGIPAPKSLAKTSEEFAEWLEKYGEEHKFAAAISRYRKVNIMLSRIEAMLARTRWVGDHYRMDYSLMYYGAVTGRWSGGGGSLNLQNLRKEEIEDFEVRKDIIAPPGKKLIVCDSSQIEPRCGAVMSKDDALINFVKTGADLYEAHARTSMGYTLTIALKDHDKAQGANLRQLAKARVLGASYGAGGPKFVIVAKTMADLTVSETEATRIVSEFRASNPKITRVWKILDNALKNAKGKPRFEIELPSGRIIPHFEPRAGAEGSMTVLVPRKGVLMRVKTWGSNLWETCCQGMARDVFGEAILGAEARPDCRVVLHVHDELVLEADEDVVVKDIEELMCIAPEWAPNLPLAAEGHEMQRYSK